MKHRTRKHPSPDPTHLGSYKYKWHISLDPRNTRRRLIVSLNLDPHHAALVDDLLDEPSILAYHLSD